MNATRHDTKAKSRRVRARKGEGSRRGKGRATLDTNRAQVVGTIAEYLVIEILEKKGWEAYQSATAEFDILATKKVGEKSLTIRIEVRTVYADKYGLKFSHSDERVPCDFYVGVRREPQEFYVVPSSKFSSRPAKRWLGRWDILDAPISFLIRWLFHPKDSRYVNRLDEKNYSGEQCLLGLHYEGDIEVFVEEHARIFELLYKYRGEDRFIEYFSRQLEETILHELIHSWGYEIIPWEQGIRRIVGSMMRNE